MQHSLATLRTGSKEKTPDGFIKTEFTDHDGSKVELYFRGYSDSANDEDFARVAESRKTAGQKHDHVVLVNAPLCSRSELRLSSHCQRHF